MFHDTWLQTLRDLTLRKETVDPRGQATRELLGASIVLEDSSRNILDVEARRLNYRFMVAEWLWMSFGRSDVKTIAQYNSRIAAFSDDGVFFEGAYGPHFNAQRFRVMQKLRRDPATRQAVMQVPRPQRDTKDEPCTLSLQFLCRGGKLHCVATMRSSDVWLGLPYDVFNFTQIQNWLAGDLMLERGWFMLNAGSLHLYERDRKDADRVIVEGLRQRNTMSTRALPGYPPSWLEDILVHRERGSLPGPTGQVSDLAWLPYAEALLAPTSEAARRCL